MPDDERSESPRVSGGNANDVTIHGYPPIGTPVRSAPDPTREVAGALQALVICNICGPHPANRRTWCDLGCGSDYNETRCGWVNPRVSEGLAAVALEALHWTEVEAVVEAARETVSECVHEPQNSCRHQANPERREQWCSNCRLVVALADLDHKRGLSADDQVGTTEDLLGRLEASLEERLPKLGEEDDPGDQVGSEG